MRTVLPVHALMLLLALPAGADPLRDMASQSFGPLPAAPDAAPELVTLGQALFSDPRLSASGGQSCASCHDPARGGADGQEVSQGHSWQTAPRNTSTVFNAMLNETPSWNPLDGADGATLSGLKTMGAEAQLAALKADFSPAFVAAFPDQPDPVTLDHAASAIDAYLGTLLTPAPFDAWLAGDDSALSAEAKAGLQLFVDRGCSFCHYGLNLGGQGYYPFGLVEAPGANGPALSDTTDAGLDFRAAPLRNVALTAPYFHSGKVADLSTAVAVMAESQLGSPLSPEETAQIVAFLESLTGAAPAP